MTNTTGPDELRRLASAFPEELPQLSARAGALIAQWEADRAALERARALVRILRIASDDPRASYETSRAYERAANDIAAALGSGGAA